MVSSIKACLSRDFAEGCGVSIMAEPGRFYTESSFTAAINIIAKKTVQEPGGWAGMAGEEPAQGSQGHSRERRVWALQIGV